MTLAELLDTVGLTVGDLANREIGKSSGGVTITARISSDGYPHGLATTEIEIAVQR